jgi:hypothetical protein
MAIGKLLNTVVRSALANSQLGQSLKGLGETLAKVFTKENLRAFGEAGKAWLRGTEAVSSHLSKSLGLPFDPGQLVRQSVNRSIDLLRSA